MEVAEAVKRKRVPSIEEYYWRLTAKSYGPTSKRMRRYLGRMIRRGRLDLWTHQGK